MRWPLVSRGTYDAVVDGLTRYRELLNAADRANSELLAKYHALRLIGAEAPAPTPQARPAVEPSLSDEAISERAGRNAGLRRHLTAERDRQRAKGMEEEDLADHVTNWASEVDD